MMRSVTINNLMEEAETIEEGRLPDEEKLARLIEMIKVVISQRDEENFPTLSIFIENLVVNMTKYKFYLSSLCKEVERFGILVAKEIFNFYETHDVPDDWERSARGVLIAMTSLPPSVISMGYEVSGLAAVLCLISERLSPKHLKWSDREIIPLISLAKRNLLETNKESIMMDVFLTSYLTNMHPRERYAVVKALLDKSEYFISIFQVIIDTITYRIGPAWKEKIFDSDYFLVLIKKMAQPEYAAFFLGSFKDELNRLVGLLERVNISDDDEHLREFLDTALNLLPTIAIRLTHLKLGLTEDYLLKYFSDQMLRLERTDIVFSLLSELPSDHPQYMNAMLQCGEILLAQEGCTEQAAPYFEQAALHGNVDAASLMMVAVLCKVIHIETREEIATVNKQDWREGRFGNKFPADEYAIAEYFPSEFDPDSLITSLLVVRWQNFITGNRSDDDLKSLEKYYQRHQREKDFEAKVRDYCEYLKGRLSDYVEGKIAEDDKIVRQLPMFFAIDTTLQELQERYFYELNHNLDVAIDQKKYECIPIFCEQFKRLSALSVLNISNAHITRSVDWSAKLNNLLSSVIDYLLFHYRAENVMLYLRIVKYAFLWSGLRQSNQIHTKTKACLVAFIKGGQDLDLTEITIEQLRGLFKTLYGFSGKEKLFAAELSEFDGENIWKYYLCDASILSCSTNSAHVLHVYQFLRREADYLTDSQIYRDLIKAKYFDWRYNSSKAYTRYHHYYGDSLVKAAKVFGISEDELRADFSSLKLTFSLFREDLSNKNLQDIVMQSDPQRFSYMRACKFRDANLSGADFRQARLANVDFTRANLTGALFGDAELIDLNLIDTNLQNVDMSEFNRVKLILYNFKLIEKSAIDFDTKRAQAMSLFDSLVRGMKNASQLTELQNQLTYSKTNGELTFLQYDISKPSGFGIFKVTKNPKAELMWSYIAEVLQSQLQLTAETKTKQVVRQ